MPCTGIYRDSYKIFQSSAGRSGRSAAYGRHSKFLCFRGYSAGVVGDRRIYLWFGNPDYYGTKYRYLRNRYDFRGDVFLFLSLTLPIIRIMPIMARIGEKEDGFNILMKKLSLSIPVRLSSQEVMVVPKNQISNHNFT